MYKGQIPTDIVSMCVNCYMNTDTMCYPIKYFSMHSHSEPCMSQSSGIWPALLCSPEHLLVFVLRNGIDIVRPYYLCIQHIYGNSKYLFYAQPIVNMLFTNLTWKCPINLPHQSHHCSVWLCQTQSQRASTCSLQPSVLGRHYDASRHCLGRASQEVVAHPAVQCTCDQVYYITIL